MTCSIWRLAGLVVFCAAGGAAQNNGGDPRLTPGAAPPALPRTGLAQPELRDVEAVIVDFMQRRQIPGGALAITKDGRLVYDRGFGFADRARRSRVEPKARFRIASVSKPFTAVAVLQLVEAGRLALDAKIQDILQPTPFGDRKPENDLFKGVTVRHLLQHRGGWNREVQFDPMFWSHVVAEEAGHRRPASPTDIIRYMAGRGLDFEPGQYYCYSNFGYCLLGRVIEKVTGETYEQFVRQRVLRPLGIRSMTLGRSKAADRLADEVRYYGQDHRVARSVFEPKGERVPWPYGGFYLEAMDSHGGWVARASDLVRFGAAFDDPAKSRLLQPASVALMFARPEGNAGFDGTRPRPRYYACGWTVQTGLVTSQEHGGSLPGTTSKLVRRGDGVTWAVLFNSRRDGAGKRIHPDAILPEMQRAISAVAKWPDGDLFDRPR